MNCDTGHIVSQELLDTFEKERRDEYQAVPAELNRAAHIVLHGDSESYVSLTSGGKLSNWARNKRKQASRKARGK